jgi:hypothetical protein
MTLEAGLQRLAKGSNWVGGSCVSEFIDKGRDNMALREKLNRNKATKLPELAMILLAEEGNS